MRKDTSPIQNDYPVQLIRLIATLSALMTFALLIASFTTELWADTPHGGGFRPSTRNAYPGGPPGGNTIYPDDEEMDEFDEYIDDDFPPPSYPPAYSNAQPPAAPARNTPAPPATSPPPPSAVAPPSLEGFSAGGTTPGGVISNSAISPIKIDSESGEGGGKQVVTDFNFPDADILDIAKALGKLTGKNFIYDKDVKGRVSVISNSPITVSDAWNAFLTALDMNGFALIPPAKPGQHIRIARNRDARDKQLKTYTGKYSPNTDALITRVFQLKYISSEEVARTFRSFMPANSRIIPYEQTNTVIVTDTGSNIAKLNQMLQILDVEGFDAGIELIPVKYASASELSTLIDKLIPGSGASTGGPGGAPAAPRFGGSGGRFTARRTKEGGIINTIISDERTNTLIVHANSKGAEQVREVVVKLDQKVPLQAGGGKVHVIYLQFADSEAIATTLNSITQGSSRATAPPPAAPGGAPGSGTGTNPVATAPLFEGNIKISADKSTNSLVVTASPSDFATIQRVVNRIDIPRDEVYVEVVIMEINLSKTFQFSSNIINPSSGLASITNGDLFSFLANPASQKGALLGFSSGQSQSVTLGPGTTPITVSSVQGLIRAIQTNSNANILATPQIIALDNTESTFESTDKIPVEKVTIAANSGVPSRSIENQPVTLSIKIKPQINKLSNFVKLDVQTKIADLTSKGVPKSLENSAFSITERSAQTSVVVGDSDTIVMGGLVRDKVSETVSKIPILGDIPLLGWLFRSKESESGKSNLVIFITPHIVRQYEKVRAILDKKLKERDEFLETNAGGEDPFRKTRDDMIRSLPDLKQLSNTKPKTTFTIDEDEVPIPLEEKPKPQANSNAAKPPVQPQGYYYGPGPEMPYIAPPPAGTPEFIPYVPAAPVPYP